jgi:hypothetical protein
MGFDRSVEHQFLANAIFQFVANPGEGEILTRRFFGATLKADDLSPALVSSRAIMLPDQPMPTITASTAFIVFAMGESPLEKVSNGLRLDDDLLAAIFQRLSGVGCRQAGISDHPP